MHNIAAVFLGLNAQIDQVLQFKEELDKLFKKQKVVKFFVFRWEESSSHWLYLQYDQSKGKLYKNQFSAKNQRYEILLQSMKILVFDEYFFTCKQVQQNKPEKIIVSMNLFPATVDSLEYLKFACFLLKTNLKVSKQIPLLKKEESLNYEEIKLV